MKADFESGALHPDDAKTALGAGINKLLQPVREHLTKDPGMLIVHALFFFV